jgi:hypothetical protein
MQTTTAWQRGGASRSRAALSGVSLLLLGIACSDSGPTAQEPADLTVIKTGTGTATIVSSPAGVSCGSTCLASFTAGTVVTLSATVDAGSTFNGWSGACGGTGSCVVTMDAARTVAAGLVLLAPNTLTIWGRRGSGGGTVTSSPAGISCALDVPGSTACDAKFVAGSTVTLTATPGATSVFRGWVDTIPPATIGACRGTSACTLTMDTAKVVIASFELSPYLIQVSPTGTGTGKVTSSPPGISCPGTCAAVFPVGTAVTLNALPDTSSTFAGWSGACTGTGPCVVIASNGPKSVGAAFTAKPPMIYKLALTKTGEGQSGGFWTGRPDYNFMSWCPGPVCEYSAQSGAAIHLIVAPAQPSAPGLSVTAVVPFGSYFAGWSGACTGREPCDVIMDGNKAVGVMLGLNPNGLTVTRNGTGYGTVATTPFATVCQFKPGIGDSCSSTNFIPGTTLTLSATPDAGSVFTGWSGDCTGMGTCAVTMTASRNVTATFTKQP